MFPKFWIKASLPPELEKQLREAGLLKDVHPQLITSEITEIKQSDRCYGLEFYRKSAIITEQDKK